MEQTTSYFAGYTGSYRPTSLYSSLFPTVSAAQQTSLLGAGQGWTSQLGAPIYGKPQTYMSMNAQTGMAQWNVADQDYYATSASGSGSGVNHKLIGAGLAVGFDALGKGIAGYFTQKGQNALLDAQAHIARNNALMAENQAIQARYAAEWQHRKVTAKYGELKSQQKTAQAANGVAIGVGSAAETAATTDIHKFIDARQVRLNGLMESFGYKAKAASYRNKAAAAEASKESALGVSLASVGNSLTNSFTGFKLKLSASLGD